MVIAPFGSVGKCSVIAWCVVGWHGMGIVGLVLPSGIGMGVRGSRTVRLRRSSARVK